jgi:uncharacterized membrane protein YkvA (DUF1232 family)
MSFLPYCRKRFHRYRTLMTVDAFIEKGAATLTENELTPLCQNRLQPITRKMVKSAGRDADTLLHMVQFLVRVVSEFDEFQGNATTSTARKEAAFALKYFLEDNDAIPDDDKEFGLKDDLIIARAVLRKNESDFNSFADACGYRWDKLVDGKTN